MPYIAHTPEEIQAMLLRIGIKSVDELFSDIPEELRAANLNLPPGADEWTVLDELSALSKHNAFDFVSFVGGGIYDHHIPRAIEAIVSRGEFLTTYTPYQAEAAQGTLQAIFEYQTAMSRLFGMDCSNAGVYDGGTAIFEAVMMARRQAIEKGHLEKNSIVISATVNPLYRRMLDCMTANIGLRIITVPHQNGLCNMEAMAKAIDETTFCVVAAYPNFFGVIEDFEDLFSELGNKNITRVICAYPLLQVVLKTPGSMGADICVAEGQSLGMPLLFGGPYLGIMTCRKEFIRQLPGRMVGRTKDLDEQTGYVLTLQSREQQLMREKALSNICSNHNLCAIRALLYVSLLGPQGLASMAAFCLENARYAAEKLLEIPGVRLLSGDAVFGNEFAVVLPDDAELAVRNLLNWKFAPGLTLGEYYPDLKNVLLVAVTEKNTKEQIDSMTDLLRSLS